MTAPVKSLNLTSKTTIPQIGFGTWQLTDPAICETAVKTALDTGYRHIDTAQVYGNEAFV
ncbi:MAG: hypothetical protein JWN01_509, partial [Patescibacteria group bacterium]|nr:hypothetical protein [Patescibacteria group bacterium]